jgi:hypothetical protein
MWIRQESLKRKKMQKAREPIIIANRKMPPFDKSIHESTATRLEENSHHNGPSDFSSKRQDNRGEEEEKMRKLVASRYARWKAGRYQ